MSLSKIKLANKKRKHELKRKTIQQQQKVKRYNAKIVQRRTRKMIDQGREEHRRKRAAEAQYMANLEAELDE